MHTNTNLFLTLGLSAIVLRIFGYMYLQAHIAATHGNLGFNCQQRFELSPADCPALSPDMGLNFTMVTLLAMVTLPKRCCGSVLSPWLLINPPSVV